MHSETQPLLALAPAARPPLSLRERRLKNLQKRVKLRSKRLRAHWGAIAAFLDLRSCVALASTCRRLAPLLRDARVWCMRLLLKYQEALQCVGTDTATAAHTQAARVRECAESATDAATRRRTSSGARAADRRETEAAAPGMRVLCCTYMKIHTEWWRRLTRRGRCTRDECWTRPTRCRCVRYAAETLSKLPTYLLLGTAAAARSGARSAPSSHAAGSERQLTRLLDANYVTANHAVWRVCLWAVMA